MTFCSRSPKLAVLPLAAVIACVCTPPALAQKQLRETVVTPSRYEQPLTEVVADLSVIDRAEIERMGAVSITQLLARLPGVQVVSHGDAARVYIRGADARMTGLYVDGARVNSQDGVSLLGGGVPWELVPVSQIERIEVLRGPASAVYGSDAMGGVIQIFTRRGEGSFTPFARLDVGSFNTQRASAGFSGAQASWDYALSAAYERSDGINTRPDLVHTPSTEAYRQSAASLRLGYQVTAAQRLDVTALNSQQESLYVPFGGGNDIKAHGGLTSAGVKWEARWNDVYSTSLSLTQARIGKKDDVPFDYQTNSQGLLFDNRFRVGGGILNAVLEHKTDAFDAKPSGFGDPAFSGERSQNALALGYGGNFGAHSIQINLRNDQNDLYGYRQTGALAYGFAFAPNWRATASTGTAFRAPTLEQVYGPYGSVQLQPETNQSHELGIGFDNNTSSFKAVAYRNEISNMITSSQTLATCAAGFFCYFNVGLASIQGATISGKHRLQDVDLRASLDLLEPRDNITGKFLSLRARQTVSFGVDWRIGGWQLGADLQHVGERFDDAQNTTILPAYTVANLGATRPLSRDWRLSLRVDNATDQSYQQVGKYVAPGRAIQVGVSWQPVR